MEKNRCTVIKSVQPGSIANEAGIEPRDRIVTINGQRIWDVFDYRFLVTEECLCIEIEKNDGEIWEIEIEKDEYEDIGVEFEDSLIDEAKSCTNKCIFCFIDQLPTGMRSTMYFKDDDSRLSFLSGNYITMTNMKLVDIERIIKYRMSPINVSVHTTNPELRKMMLGSRLAGDILEKIGRLATAGITVNTQIVLCAGINDEKELDRTISDLAELFPGLSSISVVPVGITRWRQGLFNLKQYDSDLSGKVIEQVEEWQDKLLEKYGSRVVYLADEFYIMSGKRLPKYEEYEDFPQIENGVGLIAQLIYEFYEYLNNNSEAKAEISMLKQRHVSIATGVSAYKYIKEIAEVLEKRYNYLKVTVYPVNNTYFGESVTVTGLLTGADIAGQLRDSALGNELLISRSMLKAGEEFFLDDYTVNMLENILNVKITVVDNSGEDFIKKVLGAG